MPKFLFVYHGSGEMPTSQDEIDAAMKAWGDWFEGMGDAVKDPGNPVGKSSTVSASGVVDNGGANPVTGYGVFEAADHAAAVEMAKGCPLILEGNSVEVAEIIEL